MSEIKKRRSPRCTQAQQEHLVNYMMRNETLARTGKMGIRGNDMFKNQWRGLAECLNELGPAKTWQVWHKAWQGVVRRARDKKEHIQRMAAEGHLRMVPPLTDQEEKVLAITGSEPFGWIEGVNAYGIGESHVEANDTEISGSEIKTEPSTPPPNVVMSQAEYLPGTSTQPNTAAGTVMPDDTCFTDSCPERASRKRPWDFIDTLSTLNNSSKERADELKRTNDILERWLPQISSDLQSLNTTIQTVGKTLTDMRDEAEETADNTASMRRIFMRHFSRGEEDESE